MRTEGKIVDWKDERGFGFVVEKGGDEKIFAHIKSFENRSCRPAVGDVVFFEKGQDDRGRIQSLNIQFKNQKSKRSKLTFGYYFTALFFIFITFSFYIGFLHIYILGLYFSMSALTAIFYALDKSAAKSNRWRTSENTLQLLSLCCGWPGAFFAQKFLHHKSSKVEFLVVFWVIVIINCAGLFWLFTPNGKVFFNNVILLIKKIG